MVGKPGMRALAARIVDSSAFRRGIIALIIINGIVIGAATSETVVRHSAGAQIDFDSVIRIAVIELDDM